jgi:hypothetical protein
MPVRRWRSGIAAGLRAVADRLEERADHGGRRAWEPGSDLPQGWNGAAGSLGSGSAGAGGAEHRGLRLEGAPAHWVARLRAAGVLDDPAFASGNAVTGQPAPGELGRSSGPGALPGSRRPGEEASAVGGLVGRGAPRPPGTRLRIPGSVAQHRGQLEEGGGDADASRRPDADSGADARRSADGSHPHRATGTTTVGTAGVDPAVRASARRLVLPWTAEGKRAAEAADLAGRIRTPRADLSTSAHVDRRPRDQGAAPAHELAAGQPFQPRIPSEVGPRRDEDRAGRRRADDDGDARLKGGPRPGRGVGVDWMGRDRGPDGTSTAATRTARPSRGDSVAPDEQVAASAGHGAVPAPGSPRPEPPLHPMGEDTAAPGGRAARLAGLPPAAERAVSNVKFANDGGNRAFGGEETGVADDPWPPLPTRPPAPPEQALPRIEVALARAARLAREQAAV